MPSPRHARRRIAVITGTRAEFGLLEPVLQAIRRRPQLEYQLVVTGIHLLPRFGRTIDQIRHAGWTIHATVPMQTGRDDARGEAAAVGRGISGMAKALQRLRSDIVVVLGDRIEAFAGASAAAVGRRAVAHIHGGDRAVGDVDESLRNAITRLAHVHLAASRDAARRLARMGEEQQRIHLVGAPGLDDIRAFRETWKQNPAAMRQRLRDLLGEWADVPYAVVVQHPVGRSPAEEAAAMRAIAAAVEAAGLRGIAIAPNTDPGHSGIMDVLKQLRRKSGWVVFPSLVREDYLLVAHQAALLVGNSSSGIIESASLGLNAVNVGPRQEGRLRSGPGVLDAGESQAAVLRAIRSALRRPRPRGGRSVYGDGRAAERIVKILENLKIDLPLLQKRLTF